MRQAKGLDYNKTRLRSPVTPLMRYSLADAFVVTVVHTLATSGARRGACAKRQAFLPTKKYVSTITANSHYFLTTNISSC